MSAIELAIKALESCDPGDYSTGHVIYPSYDEALVNSALEALEIALQAEQAEPGFVMLPLTDEQIWASEKIMAANGTVTQLPMDELRVVVRAVEAAHGIAAAPTTETTSSPSDAEWRVGPLTDEVVLILGRPNFTCIRYAEMLRELGQEIPRKSEFEQAAVIHWMLGFYATHGDKWAESAVESMDARRAAIATKGGKL